MTTAALAPELDDLLWILRLHQAEETLVGRQGTDDLVEDERLDAGELLQQPMPHHPVPLEQEDPEAVSFRAQSWVALPLRRHLVWGDEG